jgi:hypothetical protein
VIDVGTTLVGKNKWLGDVLKWKLKTKRLADACSRRHRTANCRHAFGKYLSTQVNNKNMIDQFTKNLIFQAQKK